MNQARLLGAAAVALALSIGGASSAWVQVEHPCLPPASARGSLEVSSAGTPLAVAATPMAGEASPIAVPATPIAVPATPAASPGATPVSIPLSDSETAAAEAVECAIDITEAGFRPARVEISKGTTVVWTNRDDERHTVTSALTSPMQFNSHLIRPGRSWEERFAAAGTFEYRCQIHSNMRGSIVVR